MARIIVYTNVLVHQVIGENLDKPPSNYWKEKNIGKNTVKNPDILFLLIIEGGLSRS